MQPLHDKKHSNKHRHKNADRAAQQQQQEQKSEQETHQDAAVHHEVAQQQQTQVQTQAQPQQQKDTWYTRTVAFITSSLTAAQRVMRHVSDVALRFIYEHQVVINAALVVLGIAAAIFPAVMWPVLVAVKLFLLLLVFMRHGIRAVPALIKFFVNWLSGVKTFKEAFAELIEDLEVIAEEIGDEELARIGIIFITCLALFVVCAILEHSVWELVAMAGVGYVIYVSKSTKAGLVALAIARSVTPILFMARISCNGENSRVSLFVDIIVFICATAHCAVGTSTFSSFVRSQAPDVTEMQLNVVRGAVRAVLAVPLSASLTYEVARTSLLGFAAVSLVAPLKILALVWFLFELSNAVTSPEIAFLAVRHVEKRTGANSTATVFHLLGVNNASSSSAPALMTDSEKTKKNNNGMTLSDAASVDFAARVIFPFVASVATANYSLPSQNTLKAVLVVRATLTLSIALSLLAGCAHQQLVIGIAGAMFVCFDDFSSIGAMLLSGQGNQVLSSEMDRLLFCVGLGHVM